jgi:Type I restriction-modification system methyltransferase subunit
MNGETHSQLANFIWAICNLLRGPYKRNEYRKVILPLTVLRRFECLLTPTRQAALDEFQSLKTKPERVQQARLQQITGHRFYNLSRMQLTLPGEKIHSLLDDPNNLAPNLNSYINGFSANVRAIMEKFKFSEQIAHMAEKNILFEVIKAFAGIDLSPQRVDQMQMGYVFEELIRIGAEQSNEEAGEHFTPREVIKLMVNLLLAPEQDLAKSHVVKTIYDPACGTGGMLSVAEEYIRHLNSEAKPKVFGQDWNDEAWAVCKSDMLIKGEDANNIILGDRFTRDGFDRDADGNKWTFDYMLANPPFGVEWKQQQKTIQQEADTLGYAGRFGAGTPRINDGALLFLQHMIAKMRPVDKYGSRIAIVFNGSPLFTGDAGSGESEIRRWIIEHDWLEAIVALPEQLFYNTGIATYIWVITNRKAKARKGKVQLIDARNFWVQMEKSLGNKRRRIGDPNDPNHPRDPDYIADITRVYENFTDGESRWVVFDKDSKVLGVNGLEPTVDDSNGQKKKYLVVSKLFDNEDFGYHKITVERPLRLNFQATTERIARLEEQTAFKNLAASSKKNETLRQQEVQAGKARQQVIRDLLAAFADQHSDTLFKDRKTFLLALRDIDRARGVKLAAPELKAVLAALGERDETAAICRDSKGNPGAGHRPARH